MTTPARRSRRRADRQDVIVAGGGMVGAAAALALAHEGFDVGLVETRAPDPWKESDEPDLRVVALAPSSARLLDQLGVWQSIRQARCSPYRHMHVWDAGHGATLDFDATDLDIDTLGWIVENRLVQHALWQAMDAAGIRRVCPAQVVDFAASDDGVHVTLEDGRDLDARLLLAADGASSPLRAMAGIGTRGRDYAQRGVVAHVGFERGHAETAWQRFLPGGPLALLPLADGRCSIVWTLPEARARDVLALDDAGFRDALGVASDLRLGRVTSCTPRAAFPLRLLLAERFHAQRLALVGDAAHVVHPLAGQGVNLGLRDVATLRDAVTLAQRDGRDIGSETVLRRYARRRRSAATLDAWSFDALERVHSARFERLAMLRGLGMRAVDRIGPIKRRLAAHAAGR